MRRAWLWLWLALAVALVARTGIRDRGVITDHLEFGQRVLHGEELYAPYLEAKPLHPVYPPGFGLLTAPFSLLPERGARVAWGMLQVLALWAIGLWARDALERLAPPLRPRLHWLLLGTAVLSARYVLRDTHGGGGNLVNLALWLTALRWADQGRSAGAAAALGLSLATKPTGLLFVPLLWLLGHRRAAAGALGCAVALTALATALLGSTAPLQRWLAGTLAYAATTDVFAAPEHGFPAFSWMNQCLRCAVARYLGTVPAAHAALVPGFVPGLGLPAEVVSWVARALAAAVLVATASVALRKPRHAVWLTAATCALSLLLSPISWKAHHVALIPAFFALLCAGVNGRPGLLWVLGGYALVLLLGGDVLGRDLKELQQSLYLVTAGTVLLWALSVWRAWRDRGGPPLALSRAATRR